MNSPVKSSLVLASAALIWGFAFSAQRAGMEHIGPFLFNAVRCLLGAATVYAVLCLKERRLAPLRTAPGRLWSDPTIRGGLACGAVLFTAGNLQQIGLVFTTASKAGFLTALYIVLVPVFGLALRHRVQWTTWSGVGLSAVGLYLLSVTERLTVEPGDLIVLSSAAFWAVHILVIDHFVQRVDIFRMCCVQFAAAGVLSAAVFPLADRAFSDSSLAALPEALQAALPGLLFVGVLSSGIGFTAQAFGQLGAPPAVAAVIMSLEAVFATIGGFLLLHERLTVREGAGCALMFAAVLLAQAPTALRSARRRRQTAPPD
ncbi:MAG: DMT family transporter [Propionibacteriaceae bacterium]|jgi:drug/metabolite transporter (DMT)-like permease|nr:DMT family transporter [Propionibacteriaceae bacterium]